MVHTKSSCMVCCATQKLANNRFFFYGFTKRRVSKTQYRYYKCISIGDGNNWSHGHFDHVQPPTFCTTIQQYREKATCTLLQNLNIYLRDVQFQKYTVRSFTPYAIPSLVFRICAGSSSSTSSSPPFFQLEPLLSYWRPLIQCRKQETRAKQANVCGGLRFLASQFSNNFNSVSSTEILCCCELYYAPQTLEV